MAWMALTPLPHHSPFNTSPTPLVAFVTFHKSPLLSSPKMTDRETEAIFSAWSLKILLHFEVRKIKTPDTGAGKVRQVTHRSQENDSDF